MAGANLYFKMSKTTDQFLLTKLFDNGSLITTKVIDRVETQCDTASPEESHSSKTDQSTDQQGPRTNKFPESDPNEDMLFEEAYPLPQTSPKDLLYRLRNATPETTAATLMADIEIWRQYWDLAQASLEAKIQRQTEIIARDDY